MSVCWCIYIQIRHFFYAAYTLLDQRQNMSVCISVLLVFMMSACPLVSTLRLIHSCTGDDCFCSVLTMPTKYVRCCWMFTHLLAVANFRKIVFYLLTDFVVTVSFTFDCVCTIEIMFVVIVIVLTSVLVLKFLHYFQLQLFLNFVFSCQVSIKFFFLDRTVLELYIHNSCV
jgi:hypothetical protein